MLSPPVVAENHSPLQLADRVSLPTKSVCTISVVRLWDLVEEANRVDFTYDNVSISYLTVLEINAAIACACCMTLKPFCARFFPRLWGTRLVPSAGRRGLEAGAGAGVLIAAPPGRGPPTIGSKPSRVVLMMQQQRRRPSWVAVHMRCDSHSQLSDDGDVVSVDSDYKDLLKVMDATVSADSLPKAPPAAHVERSTTHDAPRTDSEMKAVQ